MTAPNRETRDERAGERPHPLERLFGLAEHLGIRCDPCDDPKDEETDHDHR